MSRTVVAVQQAEEKSSELPRGWTLTTIGCIAEIQSGAGFPKHLQGKSEGDLPFAKVGDISKTVAAGNAVLTTAENYLSHEEALSLKATPFSTGSILFAKIGEAIRLNRRVIIGVPVLADNNVMGLTPRDAVIGRLLYYFMKTVDLYEYSQATTVPSIRKSDVEAIALPLAPLPEQRRIVTKIEELFTKLDAGVEALKRVKVLLKRYRQAVLKAAVEGRLTKEWREAHKGELEPASVLLERILKERRENWEAEQRAKGKDPKKLKYKEPVSVDMSNLPELPGGWYWVTVDQLISHSLNGFGKRRSEEGTPTIVLRLADILGGRISLENVRRIKAQSSEIEKYQLLPGDFLCIRVNGSRDLVGRMIGFEVANEPIIFCDHFIRLRPVKKELSPWILITCQGKRVREHIERNMVSSAGQNTVSQGTVNTIVVPLPPIAEQQRIVEEVERRLSIADEVEAVIEANLKRAERLRQSILKKAFAGKLVPQDPTDEPASVLLERIKAEKAKREAEKKVSKRPKSNTKKKQMRLIDHAE